MRLAPGQPLAVFLAFDEAGRRYPTARLAMAAGVAQMEWSGRVISDRLAVDPLLYPPEPGLQAARGLAFEGLHGFLADSLPEGWGQLLMRRRLGKAGVRLEDLSPLDRLALVGSEGRGALVFEPATTPPDEVATLDLDALAAASAEILKGEESVLSDTLADLAGASGGARPKVHVGFDGAGGFSASNGEIASGHQAWIVKFPATCDPNDIGPIEAAYADMARQAGIVLSDHRLIETSRGPGYFATRRFDRPAPGQRLHMISLAGAIEASPLLPSAGYDMFLRATHAITRHAEDVSEAFRRMVFNVLACNRDDHTRQHSYLMSRAGEWRLAPAYDLTFSLGPGGEHYMDIEGEGRNPTQAHVEALGARHGLSKPAIRIVVEAAKTAVADWSKFAVAAGVGRTSIQEIAAAQARVWTAFKS